MLFGTLTLLAGLVFGAVTAFAASGPPTPTLAATPNVSPTSSGTEAFTFSSSGASSFQCSLNGAAFAACTSPKAYGTPTLLASGSYSFQVYAVDSNGKTSGTASYSWVVDRTAPTATIALQPGSDTGTSSSDNVTNAASLVFNVTFSEPVTGLAAGDFSNQGTAIGCSVGAPTGGPSAYTVTLTGCPAGTVILRLAAGGVTDTVGNPNAQTDSATVTIDRTAPTVSSIATVPPAAGPTNASSVQWTVTFSKPVTGVAAANFSLNPSGLSGTPAVTGVSGSGLAWTVTTSTGTATPSGGGTLQLRVSSAATAKDVAGNALVVPFTTGPSYAIDKTPPTITLGTRPPDPSPTSSSTFTWTGSDPAPGSGVDHYLCSTENGAFSPTVPSVGGPNQPCSSQLTYVVGVTNNGQHQFAVEAVDAAGNVSAAVSYTWKVGKGTLATPTISTTPSPGVFVGGVVTDQATLVGANNPTGSITFTLFSDPGCGTQVFTSTNPLSGTNATSDSYPPSVGGTYYWKASYPGDSNNVGYTTPCGPAYETVVISGFTVSPSGAPAFTVTNMVPGDTQTISGIVVQVTGTGGQVGIYESVPVNKTCAQNGLGCTGSDGTATDFAHELQLTITDNTTGLTVYSGALDGLPQSDPGQSICASAGCPNPWVAAEMHSFTFTVHFPIAGGNAYQGTGTSLTFTWGRT